jgi:ribonuclease HII
VNKGRHIIGIDEVGRGPIAGPVTVSAVLVIDASVSKEVFKGIRDSKKLSEKKREAWFDNLAKAKQAGVIDYSIASVTPENIDLFGIAPSIQSAINRCLSQFTISPEDCEVLLDGGLSAPKIYKHQSSVIRGDDSIPAIAAASIIAKVTRDRKMRLYAKKYPHYKFEKNKGYGTREHFQAVVRHGLCSIHRKSFIHIEEGSR